MSKSYETKRRLAESMVELLEEMPFQDLTVDAVTRHCGVARQTFYYHFHSLMELVSWEVHRRMTQVIATNRVYGWQRCLEAMLDMLYTDHNLVMHAVGGGNRVVLVQLLKDEIGMIALRYAEDSPRSAALTPQDKALVARFLSAGTVEIVTAWVDEGMREHPLRLATRLEMLLDRLLTQDDLPS